MPLKWTISHPQRLVTAVAERYLWIEEVEEFYDAMVVANALSYGRLFDARRLDDQHASDEDFMRLGARMSAYTAEFKFGPIAFVAESKVARSLIERCLNLAPADRPMKMFKSEEQARFWLQSQPAVLA
ncbi:MAG TPA: hypothetical protein VGM96_29835 [Reyranella sp.]|jgi:hypothetical protein